MTVEKVKSFFSGLRVSIAVAILVGHVIFGVVLFFVQDSVTCNNTETLLLSGISNVQKRIAVADSIELDSEYTYLLTEYDALGKNGGYIIADKLHDIHSGKRLSQCRTLEDAGIDINKYVPLSRSQTAIFGVPCHFSYVKTNSYVVVSYIPVSEQAEMRNANVFSALGISFIISVILFFLVPFAFQLYTKHKGESQVQKEEEAQSLSADEMQDEYAPETAEYAKKTDMQPAEIFAALEALYEGACTADKNTVSAYITTFSRVNLPRKLDAVFPSLLVAADKNDFVRIKSIIDSLRKRASSS